MKEGLSNSYSISSILNNSKASTDDCPANAFHSENNHVASNNPAIEAKNVMKPDQDALNYRPFYSTVNDHLHFSEGKNEDIKLNNVANICEYKDKANLNQIKIDNEYKTTTAYNNTNIKNDHVKNNNVKNNNVNNNNIKNNNDNNNNFKAKVNFFHAEKHNEDCKQPLFGAILEQLNQPHEASKQPPNQMRGKGRPAKNSNQSISGSLGRPIIRCLVCAKMFNNSSALAKHKLTHSDERRYTCTLCSKAFKRQDHL